MKLSNLLIFIFLAAILNGCITGQAVTESQEGFQQIIVPAEEYSSDADFFDASKIHDGDLSQNAWSGHYNQHPKHIWIDAGRGKSYAFDRVQVYGYSRLEVAYSDNNKDWTTVGTLKYLSGGYDDIHWGFQDYHRYWRLTYPNQYVPEGTTWLREINWWGYTSADIPNL